MECENQFRSMMLKYSLCGMLMLFAISVVAMNDSEKDSLIILLKKASEKEQAVLLNKIAEYYLSVNTDSAFEYSTLALKAAEKSGNDEEKLKADLRIGYVKLLQGDYEVSLSLLKASLRHADSLNVGESMILARTFMGGYYYMTGQMDSALRYFEDANMLCDVCENHKVRMRNLNNMGSIYYIKGRTSDAIVYYLEAQGLADSINDFKTRSTLLLNLGNIYMERKQFVDAIRYFRDASFMAKQHELYTVQAHSLNNLGIIYRMNATYDSALYYIRQANELYNQVGNVIYEATTLGNIGSIYNYMGHEDSALFYTQKSLKLSRSSSNEQQEIIALEFLGDIYLNQKKWTKAYTHLKSAYDLSVKLGIKIRESSLTNSLAWYHYHTGSYKEAFDYLLNYQNLNDSIMSEAQQEHIAKLQTQYETEKKDKENELLRIKNNLAEIQIEKQKQIQYLLISSIVILFVLGTYIIYLLQRRSRANKELNALNNKLKSTNATLNKFFSIVSHDLRSPFSSIIGFSDLLNEELDNDKYPENVKRFSGIIHKTSEKILNLLNNLLEWANAQQGRIKFNPKPFSLNEVVIDNFELFHQRADEKGIKLECELDIPEKVFADRDLVNIILRNLISNAIKFTDEGTVKVIAKKGDHEIVISVEDNGIGISEADQLKLFRLDSDLSRQGTQKEEGSGLGLVLCREFVEKHGGEIWVQSKIDKGSAFVFTIKDERKEITKAV